jgi:hypothetical protein
MDIPVGSTIQPTKKDFKNSLQIKKERPKKPLEQWAKNK